MNADHDPVNVSRPAEPPRSAVKLLFGMVLVAAVLVGGVVGLILVFRDPLPALTAETLAAAEATWAQQGPRSYDLDLRLGGATPGRVYVEVRNGQVVKMTRDGRSPAQRRTWDVWTVEGQFAMIRRELELAADPQQEMQAEAETRLVLRAAFDPQWGYPLRYRRVVLGQGPQVSWEVLRFSVRD